MEIPKRGGFRPGSGRKPSGEIKVPVTHYIRTADLYKFGNKDNFRAKVSEFAANYEGESLPVMAIQDLTKPTHQIKPVEQPKTNFSIDTTPKPQSPVIGKFDWYKDRLIGAVTIKEIEGIMKEVKADLLSVKEKRELEAIAKECSASTSMYND